MPRCRPGTSLPAAIQFLLQITSGDNPPHARAKKRYEETAPDKYLCTQEHYEGDNPVPIVFTLTETGLAYSAALCRRQGGGRNADAGDSITRGDRPLPSTRIGLATTNDVSAA